MFPKHGSTLWVVYFILNVDSVPVKICQTFNVGVDPTLCAGRPPNDDFSSASLVSVLISDPESNFWVVAGNYSNHTLGQSFSCPSVSYVECENQFQNCFYTENQLCPTINQNALLFQKFFSNGSNFGATMETDEPSHGALNTSASVWFKWLSSVNATMRFTTQGSTFDTAIAVYKAAPWDGIDVTNVFGVANVETPISRDTSDDVSPNQVLYSVVSFPAQDGQTYFLAVGGYGGDEGLIQLEGTVEEWMYYVHKKQRTATPTIMLTRLGVERDAQSPLQDSFTLVTITSDTLGASIFFTTDGTAPSVVASLEQLGSWIPQGTTVPFLGPVPVCACVFRAVAVCSGLPDSAITSSPHYLLQAQPPQIVPDGGTFDEWVLVVVTAEETVEPLPQQQDPAYSGASWVRYTLDGSEPTAWSPACTEPLNLSIAGNGTVLRARAWVPGLVPSNVTTSALFRIRPRTAQPRINVTGAACEAPPPASPGTTVGCFAGSEGAPLVGAATLTATCADTAALLQFRLVSRTGVPVQVTIQDWAPYTGPVELGVGQFDAQVRAAAPGMAISGISAATITVLQPIIAIIPDVWMSASVAPGEYAFYSFPLVGDSPDVTVSVSLIFGQTDLILASGVPRPTLTAASGGEQQLVWISSAASGEGEQLTVTSLDLGSIPPPGGNLFLAIHGASNLPAIFFFSVSIDTSPVLTLGHVIGDTVSPNDWKYYKLYLGTAFTGVYEFLYVEAQLLPPAPLGIQVAFQRGSPPTAISAGGSTAAGSSNGMFELTAQVVQDWVGSGSPAIMFIGVQGLFEKPMNYTLTVSSVPLMSAGMKKGAMCNAATQDQVACIPNVQELFNGTELSSSVLSQQWSFYSMLANESFLSFQFVLSLPREATGSFSANNLSCLSVYLQRDEIPSLNSFISVAVTDGSETSSGSIILSENVTAHHIYYIGIYAACLTKEIYEYRLASQISKLQDPIAALSGGVLYITTSYRYYYKILPRDSYSFYTLDLLEFADLSIVLSIQSGMTNIYVSTTNPYPTRSKVGVSWSSEITTSTRVICDVYNLNCDSNSDCSTWVADETCSTNGGSDQDGTFVDIYTQDSDFKIGTYFISVYAITDSNFGIAAYTDITATKIELGNTYSQTVTTYSYEYFYVDLDDKYQFFEVRAVNLDLQLPNFMTLLVQRNRKPTTTDNIFQSNAEDRKGMIFSAINSTFGVSDKTGVFPGRYYIMVNFYPPGYVGPIHDHTYTLYAAVDPNFSASAKRDTRFPVVAATASNFWILSPLIDSDQQQTICFQGYQWQYRRIFISALSSALTIQMSPSSKTLNLTLFVRRSAKPTMHLYLAMVNTSNSDGSYSTTVPNPVVGAYYYIAVHHSEAMYNHACFSLIASISTGSIVSKPILALISYFVYLENISPLSYKFYEISVPSDNPDITIIVTHLAGATDILVTTEEKYPTRSSFSQARGGGWWKSENITGGGNQLTIRNYDNGYMSPAIYYVSTFAIDTASFYIIVQLDIPPPNVELGKIVSGQVSVSAFSNFRIVPGRAMSTLYVLVRQRVQMQDGLAVYIKQGSPPTSLDFDAWSGAVSGSQFSIPKGTYLVAISEPLSDALYVAGVQGLDVGLIQGNSQYSFTLQFLADKDIIPALLSSPIPNLEPYIMMPDPSLYQFLRPDVQMTGTIIRGNWKYFWVPVSEPTNVNLRVMSIEHNTSLQIFAEQNSFPTQVPRNSSASPQFIFDVCGKLGLSATKFVMPESKTCDFLQNTSDMLLMVLSTEILNASNHGFFIGVYASERQTFTKMNVNTAHTSPNSNSSNTSKAKSNPNTTTFTIVAFRISKLPPEHTEIHGPCSINGSLSYSSNFVPSKLFFSISLPSFSLVSVLFNIVTLTGAIDMYISPDNPFPDSLSTSQNLRSEAVAQNPQIYCDDNNISFFIGVWLAPMFRSASFILQIIVLPRPLTLNSISQVYKSKLGVSGSSANLPASSNSTYFELPGSVHMGRELTVTLIPLGSRCNGRLCMSKDCCSFLNPFSGFSLILKLGSPAAFGDKGIFRSVIYPNAICSNYVSCQSNSIPPDRFCESPCNKEIGSCCELYVGYMIKWIAAVPNKNLSDSWFLTVQGLGNSSRFTNSFRLKVSSSGGVISRSVRHVADNLERQDDLVERHNSKSEEIAGISEDMKPNKEWQVISQRKKQGTSETKKIIIIRVNRAELREEVPYGTWKIYKFLPEMVGNVSIVVTQTIGGGQGLQIFAYVGPELALESLDDMIDLETEFRHEKFIRSENVSANLTGKSQSLRKVISKNANSPIFSNITGGYPGAPFDGLASLLVPVKKVSSVWIAVYGSSLLFNPCKYRLYIDYKEQQVSDFSPSINSESILDGFLKMNQVFKVRTEAITVGFDIGITVLAASSSTYGLCAFGLNDGTPCQRQFQMTEKSANSVCSGCQSFTGYELYGLQQQLESSKPVGVVRDMTSFITIEVVSSECTANDGSQVYISPLSLPAYPFYTTLDSANSNTFEGTCVDFLVPITVPEISQVLILNETSLSSDECCTKCKTEPSCTNWMFIPTASSCWRCIDQNLSYSLLVTEPVSGSYPVFFRQNTTIPNSSWWNAPDGKCTQIMAADGKCPSPNRILKSGPSCSLVSSGCCLLSNITAAFADAARRNIDSQTVTGSVSKCASANSGSLRLDVSSNHPNSCHKKASDRWQSHATAASAIIDDRQRWFFQILLPIQQSICLVRNGSICLSQSGPWYRYVISLQAANEEGETVCLVAFLVQSSYQLEVVPCVLKYSPASSNQVKNLSSVSLPSGAFGMWRLQSTNTSLFASFQLNLALPNSSNTSICLAVSGITYMYIISVRFSIIGSVRSDKSEL